LSTIASREGGSLSKEEFSNIHHIRSRIDNFTACTLSIHKAQKLAGGSSLEDIFNGSHNISKKTRNHLILKAHDVHTYTQREIGQFLQLYPGYIYRIILKLRKG